MTSLLNILLEKVNEIIALKQLEITELQKKGLSTSKDEFKLKSYLRWPSKIKNCLNSGIETQYNLTSKMDTERKKEILHYLASDYGFKKSLLDKIELLIDQGENVEFETTAKIKKSLKKLGVNPGQTIRKLPKNKKAEVSDNGNGNGNVIVNGNGNGNGNINVNTIEAVPKQLAEEGARPGDDRPIAQAEYDLRLLHGVGPVLSKKLVKQGMRLQVLLDSWEELLRDYPEYNSNILELHDIGEVLSQDRFKWLNMLNHHQLLGIKYFKDITIKIPRAEVAKIEKFLQIVAKKMNPNLIIQCCGSYRRGRDRSGDADGLMTHQLLKTQEDVDRDRAINGNILSHFAFNLTKLKFLTDHLTEDGYTKYMGFCKLPNKINRRTGKLIEHYDLHRRIDVRFVPYNSYGSALLYFTGSKNFNTAMRRKALKMGYTLSEYGLYKLVRDENGKIIKGAKGEQLPTPKEEDVFRILKMEYKTPQERDI